MGIRIAVLVVLLALAACATAPTPTQGSPTPTQTSAPRSAAANAIEALLRRAGQGDAPNVQAVERALGAADLRRDDGAGTLLTYRLPNCALLLVFSNGRLAEANPGPERLGGARPSLAQCAEAAAAAR